MHQTGVLLYNLLFECLYRFQLSVILLLSSKFCYQVAFALATHATWTGGSREIMLFANLFLTLVRHKPRPYLSLSFPLSLSLSHSLSLSLSLSRPIPESFRMTVAVDLGFLRGNTLVDKLMPKTEIVNGLPLSWHKMRCRCALVVPVWRPLAHSKSRLTKSNET